MQLETKRLLLREYKIEDFNDLYEILSDSEVMAYYPELKEYPDKKNDVSFVFGMSREEWEEKCLEN